MNNPTSITPSLVAPKIYRRGEIIYDENPLINRIDPIHDDIKRLEKIISYLPPKPTEKKRRAKPIKRLRAAAVIPRIHVPLTRDFEVASMIGEMIREGYVDRAPNAKYWERHSKDVEAFYAAFTDGKTSEKTDRGYGITAVSGSGKTRTVSKALSAIPPLIQHSRRENPNAPLKQVTWIRVECPHNRSTGDIAAKIIREIGNVVGAPYDKQFNARTNDDLITNAASLVRAHYVGLIVVDEIQNAVARSKNPRRDLVDLLVELANELGVPMLFLGTPKANSLIGSELRAGRRITGAAWKHWGPDHPDWVELLTTIWEYQFTAVYTPLDDNLRRAIYDLTQGIPAFLTRLFHLVQRKLIIGASTPDEERITSTILRETAEECLSPVRPILGALASGDEVLISRYEDLPSEFNLEEAIAKESEKMRLEESALLRKQISNARKRAGKHARARIVMQAALTTPTAAPPSSPPITDTVVRAALQEGRDPIKALIEAGLVSSESLSKKDVSDVSKN